MVKYFLRNRLCFIIKGYNRAILYDSIRLDYEFIPLEIARILSNNSQISFNVREYEEQKYWINFLIEKEVLFEIELNDVEKFPQLDLNFHKAKIISSLITHSGLTSQVLKRYFIDLSIDNLTIIANKYSLKIIKLLHSIQHFEINDIHLYFICENQKYQLKNLLFLRDIAQVTNVFFFNSTIHGDIDIIDEFKINNIIIPFEIYKSQLFKEKLRINKDLFIESQNFNTYANKKIYFDMNGDLKNAPNYNKKYGNISDIDKKSFFEIINSKNFQSSWQAKKENTLVCSDCEFRHMCIDSRMPYKNSKNKWYHKVECRYNPYLSKWENEKGHKTLQNTGININESGELKIDRNAIKENFNKIWDID